MRQSKNQGGAAVEGRVRGSAGVGLAALTAAMLVLSGLFAAPARAQQTVTDPFDLLVDVSIGECGAEGCPDDQRPVTVTPSLAFSTELETLLENDSQLTDAEIADILAAAEAAADFEITILDSEGDVVEEDVEPGVPVCLDPGDYTAEVSVADAQAVVAAFTTSLEQAGSTLELTLDVENAIGVEEDFTIDECDDGNDDDDDNGNVVIDDRDQTNACNQVINIILDQNTDVDNTQNGVDDGDEQPVEVTDEQVVDIAQELNFAPTIVQQCIQQNVGRDAKLRIGDEVISIDEKIIDEEFDDEEDVVIKEEFDDDEEGVTLDGRDGGEVLADTIPNQLLPNTGGISPSAVLAGLGFALLLAGLSAGYAAARRRS